MNRRKLSALIVEKGMKQYELAEMIGINKNTFSNKLNGKSFFNTEEIDRICDVLEIVDDDLKVKIFLNNHPNYGT